MFLALEPVKPAFACCRRLDNWLKREWNIANSVLRSGTVATCSSASRRATVPVLAHARCRSEKLRLISLRCCAGADRFSSKVAGFAQHWPMLRAPQRAILLRKHCSAICVDTTGHSHKLRSLLPAPGLQLHA